MTYKILRIPIQKHLANLAKRNFLLLKRMMMNEKQ